MKATTYDSAELYSCLDRFNATSLIRAALVDVTVEANMDTNFFQINNTGVIEEKLPEAPAFEYGGRRRYSDSAMALTGGGRRKILDPNCISGFFRLKAAALKRGDDKTIAAALSTFFYEEDTPVSHDITDFGNGDVIVRINLPLSREGLSVDGKIACSKAATKNQRVLDTMSAAALELRSFMNQQPA